MLSKTIFSNLYISSLAGKTLETNHIELACIQGRTAFIIKAILERVIYTCLNFGMPLLNGENIVKWSIGNLSFLYGGLDIHADIRNLTWMGGMMIHFLWNGSFPYLCYWTHIHLFYIKEGFVSSITYSFLFKMENWQ